MDSRYRPPFPREHGAWAMLIAPLITGIGAARIFNLDTLLLALCAFGFFLLRLPLMLAIKSRALDTHAHALRWSAIYAAFTAAFGVLLLLSSRLEALVPLGAMGGFILIIYLALAARRAEMSLLGEWLGIAGLALSAPAAYLVGTQVLDWTALGLYVLNVFYFGGTVVYVKFKVREQPRTAPTNWVEKLWAGRVSIAYHAIVFGWIGLFVALGWMPAFVSLAFILPLGKVLGGVLTKPARLNIKRIGFIELGFTLAFLLIVVIAYHV
jgi:hypothetical protein